MCYEAGGLHARVFAARYPEEVVGMVLVDASPEGQDALWPRRPFHQRVRIEMESVWLSSNSVHLTATTSGHMIQLEEPDLVIDAIRRIVDAARLREERIESDPRT